MKTDKISICVYKGHVRGKKVARRNGRRITLTLANKLVAGKVTSKIEVTENYDNLIYEI